MTAWAPEAIPAQTGKLAIVTGANSGIGYVTARELARAGAQVILACRADAKGGRAIEDIRREAPGALVTYMKLDLASLASVRDFAARVKDGYGALDILVNNAGVMALPARRETLDGFEMQIGVNFLGHFALTALLLPILMRAPAPRVIQLASIAHRSGRIKLADLNYAQGYKPWPVYQQSKLAMLMFALELQRRSDAGGWGLISLAAHPGVAATELVANGPGVNALSALGMKVLGPLIFQSAKAGAWPSLLAATAPDVKPGGYYGSTGFMEMRGPAGEAKIAKQALDRKVAAGLWDLAESLTGVTFTPGP